MKTRDYCKTLAEKYATSSGLGTMFPLPGLTAVITVVEIRLVQEIARAYGETLSGSDAAQWIVLSGAKNVGIKFATEALLFIPFYGWLARPILTQWSTGRLGQRAIDSFEGRHPNAEYVGAAAPSAPGPQGGPAPVGASA